MILIITVEDRLALEIGSQVMARHKLEVEADALRKRIAELDARCESLAASPPRDVSALPAGEDA